MARPDIKDERRDQILDAFETCVARYGVAGATLAKTAEIAGLARPLVRHNVGNREDLLKALVDRILQQSRDSMVVLQSSLPAEKPSRTLIVGCSILIMPTRRMCKCLPLSSRLRPTTQSLQAT